MKKNKELVERTKLLSKSGEMECYLVVSDIGCAINAKGNQLLTMISCLINEVKKDFKKEDLLKAVEIGYDIDIKDTKKKSIESIENRVLKEIEKIKDILKEFDNE